MKLVLLLLCLLWPAAGPQRSITSFSHQMNCPIRLKLSGPMRSITIYQDRISRRRLIIGTWTNQVQATMGPVGCGWVRGLFVVVVPRTHGHHSIEMDRGKFTTNRFILISNDNLAATSYQRPVEIRKPFHWHQFLIRNPSSDIRFDFNQSSWAGGGGGLVSKKKKNCS